MTEFEKMLELSNKMPYKTWEEISQEIYCKEVLNANTNTR